MHWFFGAFSLSPSGVLKCLLMACLEQNESLVAWVGFNQTYVMYDRDVRFAGTTKYPLKKMLALASNAILAFSNVPLKIATWLGFTTSLAAFFGIISLVDFWAFGEKGQSLELIFARPCLGIRPFHLDACIA